jgi:hypothetical protein
MGADAAIILTRGDMSKVAIFEAKWPRFKTPAYRWDYGQTSSGISHFSDQLERQKRWHPRFAVFEMIYSEHDFDTLEPYLMPKGSSCIWHEEAETFRQARQAPDEIWSQLDLKSMLSTNRKGISEIMHQFGRCEAGEPIFTSKPSLIDSEYRLPSLVLSINASEQ